MKADTVKNRAPTPQPKTARTFRAYALAATLLSSPSIAHATTPEDKTTAHLITVTANKKYEAQSVQEVPLAVNVFNEEKLESLQLRDIQTLTHSMPNVSLDTIGGFRGVANFAIRGLGINSSIASVDPAVGLFVDGVYSGINLGSAYDLFDVASIQVLRGPQGTLFGRNTTGGAVLIETLGPTRDWQGKVRMTAETPVDNGRGEMLGSIQAALSGPLTDTLAFRVSGYHASDGGYFRNLYDNSNFGKNETTMLRGALAYEQGPLAIIARANYTQLDGDGAPGQNHGWFDRDTFDLALDNRGYMRSKGWSTSVQGDYDLGQSRITAIFGYSKFKMFTSNDIDSTPLHQMNSQTGVHHDQISGELRWAGRINDTIDLTVGGYLFHQKVAYDEDRVFPSSAPLFGGGSQSHNVQALFAQSDWNFAPDLILTTGLRWSREAKDAEITFVRARPACSVIAGTCPITGDRIPGEPNGVADKNSWNSLSPKIGLSWQATPNTLAYTSWSRGDRSGGYNLRLTQPAEFISNANELGAISYGAERVDSFEVGMKWQSANSRATLNLAAFQTNVHNMQREVSIAIAGSGLAQSIYNTANARIRGAEIEATFAFTPNLKFHANLGYIQAQYTKILLDITGDKTINDQDYALALPRTPRWTWSLGGEHRIALGNNQRLITRVDFNRRSRYAYTDNNFGWISASNNLTASLTWDLGEPNIRMAIYGRNLLDEVQFGSDTQHVFGGPISTGVSAPYTERSAMGSFSPLNKGRVLGAEITMAF